jgi:hypothetical protein
VSPFFYNHIPPPPSSFRYFVDCCSRSREFALECEPRAAVLIEGKELAHQSRKTRACQQPGMGRVSNTNTHTHLKTNEMTCNMLYSFMNEKCERERKINRKISVNYCLYAYYFLR